MTDNNILKGVNLGGMVKIFKLPGGLIRLWRA